MADSARNISDGALAVFAFAAYHELQSGLPVASVTRRDGSGHSADDGAVEELQSRGLVVADASEIRFTPDGERIKQELIAGLRKAIKS